MQTFLPYPDFYETARCLDYRRLGKQRVETWQLYLSLTQPEYGWKNHPASKMWKGYERALTFYGTVICEEWIKRGYKDSLLQRFLDVNESEVAKGPYIDPHFINDNEFHKSHQSNLLRKDLNYYSKYFPDVPSNLPYIWPIKEKHE